MRSEQIASDRWNPLAVSALGLILLLAFTALATSEEIRVDYDFVKPEISEVFIGGERYHRITMPGASSCGSSGEPALPAMGARILLPEGSRVTSVELMADKRVVLGTGFRVEPVSLPVRLSADPGERQRRS